MKLTLEQLAVYLPCGLKLCENTGKTKQYTMATNNSNDEIELSLVYEIHKCYFPIVKPLSDYKDVTGEAMSELNIDVSDTIEIYDFACGHIGINQVTYGVVQIMAEHHIDMFNWISDGLAINKKTLKK